jgi:hypothetical protein
MVVLRESVEVFSQFAIPLLPLAVMAERIEDVGFAVADHHVLLEVLGLDLLAREGAPSVEDLIQVVLAQESFGLVLVSFLPVGLLPVPEILDLLQDDYIFNFIFLNLFFIIIFLQAHECLLLDSQ